MPASSDAPTPRLSGADATWLRVDRPTNRVIINAVFWFDRAPDLERLREDVRTRIVEVHPRFRARVVEPAVGGPRFEPVAEVALDEHVREVRLADGSDAALRDLVSRIVSTDLDRERPLWELVLARGPDGHGVLVARVHHCIADGISLAQVLLALTETEDGRSGLDATPSPRFDASPPKGVPELLRRGVDWVRAGLKIAFTPADRPSALRGRPSGTKRVAWLPPIPLKRVKAAAERLGATVNDLAMTALTGALRAHLADHGEVPDRVRAVVPFNLRPADPSAADELGNRFGLVLLGLPTAARHSEARLQAVRAEMSRIKAGAEGPLSYGVITGLGFIPKLAERWVVDFYVSKGSAIVTNVPGPDRPIRLAGQTVTGLVVWVPQAGDMGLGVSLLSYDRQLWVGFVADAALVPEPEGLADRFHAALETLLEAGGATTRRPASV